MRITKYIHSCLLIEKGGDRLLFDPGKFSFVEGLVKPEQFRDLTAIILTHYHPDHVDDAALKKIVAGNPSAVVLVNSEIQQKLARQDIATELQETGRRAVGAFTVEAFAAPHAPLLDSPSPRNTAYLIDDLLMNPGDSFAAAIEAKKGTAVLALPIMAPWSTEITVAEFARRMAPRQIIPVHDGYAKDFFRRQRYENFAKHFSREGIEFHALAEPGDSVVLGSRDSQGEQHA